MCEREVWGVGGAQTIMHKCWESDPARRLNFESIRGILAAVRIEEYPSDPAKLQVMLQPALLRLSAARGARRAGRRSRGCAAC